MDISETDRILFRAADEVRRENYGTDVYIRGLIEFTNYCRNDCYYCGIRCSNSNADRYRLRHETADKQHYDRLHPSTAVFHYVGNIAFDISGISAKVSYENMWRSHFCSMQSAPCALFPTYVQF